MPKPTDEREWRVDGVDYHEGGVHTIKLPKPFPHQVNILNDQHRYKAVAIGRRGGKTTMAGMACVIGHGQGKYKGALQGGKIGWFSPTNGMASDTWRTLKNYLHDVWQEKREDERWIKLPDTADENGETIKGGQVIVKSTDNEDASRGIGLDGAVLDECAYMSEYFYYDVLRPALADHKGWVIFISTPKLDDEKDKQKGSDWFKNLFLSAQEKRNWATWQLPSWVNPIMTQDEIEELRHSMDELHFKVEIEAQFLEASAGIFRPEMFKYYMYDAVNGLLLLDTDQGMETCKLSDCHIYSTMDLAHSQKSKADYTVLTTFAITPQNRLVVLEMVRQRFTEAENQKLIYDTFRKWYMKGIVGSYFIGVEESVASINFIHELQLGTAIIQENTNGYNKITKIPALPIKALSTKSVQRGENAKVARALTAQVYYKNHMVFHPNDLMGYAWKKDLEYELLRFPNPRVHDDIVDTIGYACLELSLPRYTFNSFPSMIAGGAVRY